MFTDIIGYTAMMGADEDQAFDLLTRNRALHKQIIQRFRGTLIKELGDGMLISFDLSSDGVRCAMAIQKEAQEQGIPLKIGIHEGEVVFEGGDILGDGVNIASRLQASAHEGCIYISSSVYNNVRNKADIHVHFVEEYQYKNVSEPIKVYAVSKSGTVKQEPSPKRKKRKRKWVLPLFILLTLGLIIIAGVYFSKSGGFIKIDENLTKSIAVLPLDDLSPEKDQGHIADGISETIINHLFNIEDIEIRSKNSSFAFRGQNLTTREYADKLNVNYVLEGSVLRDRNNLKVTIRLIEALRDKPIWSKEYPFVLSNIF